MPRRTVTVSHVFVHDMRKVNQRKDVASFDRKGADLLALLRAFIATLPAEALVDDEKERYLSTTNLDPKGRTLLVEMEMGWFGLDGKVRNSKSHELEHEHGAASATTTDVRFLATAPVGSPGMLVFVERVGRSAAGAHVLPLFHKAWRQRWSKDKLVMKVETLVETEAWLKKAQLEEVSGTVTGYDWGHDVADNGKPKILGQLETTLVPAGKQEFLPKFIWEGLRDKNLEASTLLGFPDGLLVDDVQVRVSADGKAKTFAIDREKQPAVSYVLSKVGAPDDEAFRNFCFGLAADLYPKVGGEWKSSDQGGNWTDEQLSAELALGADEPD